MNAPEKDHNHIGHPADKRYPFCVACVRNGIHNDWHEWIDVAPIGKLIDEHIHYGITDVQEDDNVTILNIVRSDHQELAKAIRDKLKGE